MSATTTTTAMSTEVTTDCNPVFGTYSDPNSGQTISDQVTLCREIAKQLVCDQMNDKSKGRQMFERRVQKSSKWVTTTTTATDDDNNNVVEDSEDFHERTISEGPPNLRLVLDPRHVQDINSLDFESNEQTMNEKKSRDNCLNIVKDLTSPQINKGNALFAKRALKSSEWIVAESVVDAVVEAARDKCLQQTTQQPDEEWTPMDVSDDRVLLSDIGIGGQQHYSLLKYSENIAVFYPKYRDFNAKAKPFCRRY